MLNVLLNVPADGSKRACASLLGIRWAVLWILLIAPACAMAQELTADDPIVQAFALVKAGRHGEAIPHFERALLAAQNTPGVKASALAILSNELAVAYYHDGQPAPAEAMYRQAIKTQEQADPPELALLATLLNNLAALYHRQNRFDEAELLYQRVLEIQSQAFGPQHISIALALRNLASLYERQGLLEQARAVASQAAGILKTNCNPTANGNAELKKVCLQATPLIQHLFEKLGISGNAAAAAPVPSVPVATAGKRFYRVQVRSSKVQGDAEQELEAMRRAHPDLLGDLPSRVVRADLGERGVWYRVQFGEFADSTVGKHLCWRLEERGLTCWVVRTS